MPATENLSGTAQEGVPTATSPKVWAASVSAIVTAYAVGLLSKALGGEVDVPTLTLIIGPPIVGAFTYLAGYVAKLGQKYIAQAGLVDYKLPGPANDDELARAGVDLSAIEVEPDNAEGEIPEDARP